MKIILHSSRTFGIHLSLIAAFIFVFQGVQVVAQAPARPDPQGGVRAGEIIQVRIEENLSTRNARRGQTFQTSILQPVRSTNGTLLIPRGSIIYGRVDSVQQPLNRRRPGIIEVSFNSIKFPNGRRVPFSGSLVSPDDTEGQVSGSTVSRRKVSFVGATGGALIGAIASGASGAVAGGLIGATGALLTRRFTTGAHADVKRNTEFGIYVDRRLDLPPYA